MPLSAATEIGKEGFVASGGMGDAEKGTKYVKMDAASKENPHTAPTCQKWSYTGGEAGWAAFAWQAPANNWGDKPGKKLPASASKVSWYARGAMGGEEIEFFAGGNTDPAKTYQSSLEKISASVTLTRDWKKYSLDLKGDLSAVMCAFGWALQGSEKTITFYLDEIQFESSVSAETPPAVASPRVGEFARADAEISSLGFKPSGHMGDGEKRGAVNYDDSWKDNPNSLPSCQKWNYTPGSAGWAAVAWQAPANNWGDKPGTNLMSRRFTKITFYARGMKGGEQVEFFSGGNTAPGKPYQASYQKVSEMKTLTREWKKHSLDLSGQNLSAVICAFGWASDQGVTFFLDDVRFE